MGYLCFVLYGKNLYKIFWWDPILIIIIIIYYYYYIIIICLSVVCVVYKRERELIEERKKKKEEAEKNVREKRERREKREGSERFTPIQPNRSRSRTGSLRKSVDLDERIILVVALVRGKRPILPLINR